MGSKSPLANQGESKMKLFATASTVGILTAMCANAQITGRTPLALILGVTFDDDLANSEDKAAIQGLVHTPTSRVVVDPGVSAGTYKSRMSALSPYTYWMVELVDSSYMAGDSQSTVQSLTNSMVSGIGNTADLWEIGNEVNGNWLSNESNGADVIPKIDYMYNTVAAAGGKTVLTFFYEGEPSDPNNCIATGHGGNDMFTWIATNFTNAPTTKTQAIRTGVNYVGVSWYPDQCPGENPNWGAVFTKLAGIFPNAQVGFTELGTANPENGSAFEQNEISTYYPMQAAVGGLPANYFGGYFWWYFAEEYKVVTPWINAAVGGGREQSRFPLHCQPARQHISRAVVDSDLRLAGCSKLHRNRFHRRWADRVGEGLALSHDHLFHCLHRRLAAPPRRKLRSW
jgi:hypothetical protein